VGGLILAMALAVQAAGGPAPAPAAKPADWAGDWKSADPEAYPTLEITDVDATGFALAWDENVGFQGARATGRAAWSGRDGARFEQDGCALVLARRGARIDAEVGDGCFNWGQHARLTFVRVEVPVHQRTSFDCARAAGAVEAAVCADRDLASADRRLAAAYRAALARAGSEALRAGQREWIAGRERGCAADEKRRACLLRAYGRRTLELRAWPEAAFAGERPNVRVLRRVLARKGALADSGVRELAAGLVGGIPDEMDLALHDEPGGIWLAGCDQPDRSRGFDPLGMSCGRQHYLAFREDGAIWAAWADAEGVAIVPAPREGQTLPPSLVDFQENHGPPDDDDAGP
jgi:uncharacterized protein YecT (DUF1311 family)